MAERGVRHGADPGREIVRHVRGVRGRWDDAGHRPVAENVFEEELRPIAAAELGRDTGKGPVPELPQQGAFLEGPVDEDGDAARLGQG